MKKKQWITGITGVILIIVVYFFGNTIPPGSGKKTSQSAASEINIDTILHHARERISPEQVSRLAALENSVVRGDVRSQQMEVYHQLAHFWKDSAGMFEPYAWYEAEAARLENSEKSLTFAAHLFLENLRAENNPQLRRWKTVQAIDLFERSLKINAANDSSQVGLGACYIFGGISESPMEGIQKVLQVVEKDSNHVFAHLVLGHGSVISGQYDKAVSRFEKVVNLQPANLEAIMMLAEVFERKADKTSAIKWYSRAADLVKNPELRLELQKRIEELNN